MNAIMHETNNELAMMPILKKKVFLLLELHHDLRRIGATKQA